MSPVYDYDCPGCGRLSDIVRGYDDYTTACPSCGKRAERVPVYQSQGLVVHDGPNAPLPAHPQTDPERQVVQELYGKEVKKRGWSADRAIGELRANKFEDETGALRIDTTKMTQVAE